MDDDFQGRGSFDPVRYCEQNEPSFSAEFGYRDEDEGYTGEEGEGETW